MPEIPRSLFSFWECFLTCDSQLRAGFGGAYALDWKVVMMVARDMGIKRTRFFYRALKTFEGSMIEAMNKKQPQTE
jgi:hypothetical protein